MGPQLISLVREPVKTAPTNSRLASRRRGRIAVLALLLSCPLTSYAQPIDASSAHEASPSQTPPPTAQPADPHDATEQEPSRMNIRGFADVEFRVAHGSATPSTFTIGQLDMFITSQLAADLNFVSEVVFEANDENSYGLDVERLLLQFSPSDYLNIGVGRYHTAIGFYNNAYHHGAWFQTALGRPELFVFEDDDGILPVHGVGITARGRIPSGRLGLRWIAELGNGRQYGTPEAVQVVQDDNSYKAVNVGFLLRPESVPGFQSGLSVYRDKLVSASGDIDQSIIAAHAVYQSSGFEQLNEVVLVRDTPAGGAGTFTTTGIYTQFSRPFGRLTPYLRYEHLHVAEDDPLFGTLGGISGPSIGVRYDFRDLAAIKVQWDRFTRRPSTTGPVNGVTAQVAFTF